MEAIRDGARLAALRDLGLLDGSPEESFDRITRLVSATLGVPVSLVSLVDADRQFFLSEQGLTGDWAKARQTPLSHSFCQHAVAARRPLVINDARRDPLVSDNLAVRDLGVIAYAGVPIGLADGHAVGALCAIDNQPRCWSERELAVLQDLAATVEELLELRASVAREGLYDRLTGLPNRSLLVSYAEQYLRGRDGRSLVVMCAGLDDFTQINQALGTDAADAVLKAAGQRLTQSMRTADVLGRLRGDMFTILARDIEDEGGALALAGRIRAALAATPLQVDDQQVSVAATIGIAIARPGSRAADLISEAANAMRQAKRHHSRARVAQTSWSEQAASRLRLQEALRGALGRGEIRPVYQPIVDLNSGQIRAFETLARWAHPQLGAVSPAEFIPAAEATGDIIAIGERILKDGCDQLARWHATGVSGLSLTVNIAPLQLEQPNLAESVDSLLRTSGLPAKALVLEITEGVLLENATVQNDNLRRLRRLGIRIALDDFGTGYSALGYLTKFPIDIIKIDRSFVANIETDPQKTALIQAILAMAKGMNLEIVAEGIETQGQQHLLRQLGCRHGQGFLFSRPVPPDQIDASTTY